MKRLDLKNLAAHFGWQTTVKGGRALGGALARVLHLRDGGMTSRWYNAAMGYAKFVVRLQRRSGWQYVVVYLKACSVLLQQAAGGQKIANTRDLKAAVSRTRSGIPRVIPRVMRIAIRSGDIWTIRLWLTFFGLYRVVEIPSIVKLGAVANPSTLDVETLVDWISFLNGFAPVFFRELGYGKLANLWLGLRRSARKGETPPGVEGSTLLSSLPARGRNLADQLVAQFIPKGWEGLPWNLKPRLLALLKSSPNTSGVRPAMGLYYGRPLTESEQKRVNDRKEVGLLRTGTSIGVVFTDYLAWTNPQKDEALNINSWMWPLLQEWLKLTGDTVLSRLSELSAKVIDQVLPDRGNRRDPNYPGFGRLQGLGKLGFLPEPAGKTRIIAMVDGWTQMAMKPVHDLLFHLLGLIPQDGTFDQMAPAKRLAGRGHKIFFSYDLSSATDRFPVLLQQPVLALLLGSRLASLWVSLLTDRTFLVPGRVDKKIKPFKYEETIRYGAGQPQGALTSWAAFSLTHHLLVQYAAYRAYHQWRWFSDYALLGDDIVIADVKVANEYLASLRVIGVEVGLAKSLISRNGSFEFAKRTFVSGRDASAISLQSIGAAIVDTGVLEQVLVRANPELSLMEALRMAAKVCGYGYKTLARLPAVLESKTRLQGMSILLTRPGSPWAMDANSWFLQARPGVVVDNARELSGVIRGPLWVRLKASLVRSLDAHSVGIGKVTMGDSYGTGATVMDPGNWHRNTWEYYVLGSILREHRAELDAIRERVKNLRDPTFEDLNSLYERVDGLKEELAALPTTPNIMERVPLVLGGRKRSATLRLWRGIRRIMRKGQAGT
jgi:hypothetical protein